MAGVAVKVFFVMFFVYFKYSDVYPATIPLLSSNTNQSFYKIIPNTETCKVLDFKLVHNYTCKSKNVNRTLNLGSKVINFQPGVYLTNYHPHIVFFRKFTTIYRQFMIDIHIDICALLAGKKLLVAPHINTERRRKYGNLNDPCPITGRRYETNVPFSQSGLPEMFPSGEYRVDATRYTFVKGERKYLTLTQSYGEVKYKTAEQW